MPDLHCLETIRNAGELNRLLILVRELGKSEGRASRVRLELVMQEQTFQADPVTFDDLLNLALHFRLIHVTEDAISITPTGNTFLNNNPNDLYQITESQKELLVKSILFGRTQLSKQFEFILGDFTFNPKSDRYEGAILAPSGRLPALGIRLLCSAIGFVNEGEEDIRFLDPLFNTDISRRIRIFRNAEWDGRPPTEETLAQSKYAEELVYVEEKKRLELLGLPELSRRVQLVSEYNAAAGFDIQSFDGDGSRPEVPDRFIEVKSSNRKKMHFVFTRTEHRKAQELRDKYRIIFIGNLSLGKHLEEYRVETIIDPYEKIYDRDKFVVDASRFHVTEIGINGLEISEDN